MPSPMEECMIQLEGLSKCNDLIVSEMLHERPRESYWSMVLC